MTGLGAAAAGAATALGAQGPRITAHIPTNSPANCLLTLQNKDPEAAHRGI